MNLTFEDVETLLRVFRETDYSEVRIEIGDFKLAASKSGQGLSHVERSEHVTVSVAPKAPQQEVDRGASVEIEPGTIAIRAEVSGQFYRSPSPGAEPFCKPGMQVAPDTVICLVEIMKLFTSVMAGVSGTITRILVENGSPVEAGQPLILIRPDRS